MTTIAAMVEEHRVDELTKQLIANGWGENYSLVDKNYVDDERLYAAPDSHRGGGTSPLGLVIKPGAEDGTPGATDEVFITNLEDRLRDVDLAAEEKRYYAHRIAEGGTFVVVEVDDADLEKVRAFFAEVDAQQMKTAV